MDSKNWTVFRAVSVRDDLAIGGGRARRIPDGLRKRLMLDA